MCTICLYVHESCTIPLLLMSFSRENLLALELLDIIVHGFVKINPMAWKQRKFRLVPSMVYTMLISLSLLHNYLGLCWHHRFIRSFSLEKFQGSTPFDFADLKLTFMWSMRFDFADQLAKLCDLWIKEMAVDLLDFTFNLIGGREL